MSEMKSVLEVVRNVTSNRESGRLEINASGTHGTLLFHEGKLVDARLGSLSGFQAVNAAVALRDVHLNFDHVDPALHVSTITQSERVVLKRFFGIEAAEIEEPASKVEPEMGWNQSPEPVVPLAASDTMPAALFSKPRLAVAVFLSMVLGLAIGTVALRSAIKSRQQAASVASAVAQEPSIVRSESPVVAEAKREVTGSSQPVSVSERTDVPARGSSPVGVSARRESEKSAVPEVREAKVESKVDVQDLNGEWRIINTVQKTGYKSFANLEVGFRLTVNQNGKEFTAKGEKFFENGQTLPAHRRTPISMTGTIDGDKVVATFIEDGRLRRTNGRFVWKLQNGGNGLAGTFVSTAANTNGRSVVTKQ